MKWKMQDIVLILLQWDNLNKKIIRTPLKLRLNPMTDFSLYIFTLFFAVSVQTLQRH